jgi:serine/threonine-protein kinase
MIGRTLPGGYIILDLVGIGGMGRVYRAEQTALSRTVAVKVIHPHLVGEENTAARFITEARAASRLNHPNSVGVIDFGKTDDGQLYLVMEFLRGKDLARVQYEAGSLTFRRTVSILRQVLAALAEAHHLEIIHRDLKPENIILEPVRSGGDFVKVVDFGLAKMRAETAAPGITSPGIVCGTPEYMSPEQGRGDTLDPRSDIYAVGVVMYQLLAGRLPFEAESPTQVVLMHIGEPPKDPREVAPEREIPEALVLVCLKALQKEPEQRFNNADEFSEALDSAMAEIDRVAPRPVAAPQTVKCAKCGAQNPFTQKFCGDCGTSLAAARSQFPPAAVAGVAAPDPSPSPGVAQAGNGAAARVNGQGGANGADVNGAHADRPQFPLPLVGRDEDLAWLNDRRNDAKSSLIGARVVGDSGMGKTRLLKEFLANCRAAGDVVVITGPDPNWAEVGYFALRHTIRELAALPDKPAPKDWVSASAEARRGLSDVFEVERDGSARLSPEERRYAVADALRWAIVRANERSGGKKVIVAVDDLNHIDGGSRAAFADAVGEPPLVPALLAITYPPGADPGWPASTASARVLTGLDSADVGKLVSGKLSVSSPAFGPGRGIAPLYVDQLLRFAKEQGGQPPARLADLIALRVERMPPNSRRVMQAIAVFGDLVTEPIIARMVSDRTKVKDASDQLQKAGMVEVDADRLKITHPLLREVVLATIPNAVRRELHAQAATISEEMNAAIEARALHEFQSQNTFQALILLEQVSSKCTERGDTMGTITALRRGLELARRELFRGELEDPLRAVLIFSRKLGEALTQAGQFTDAEGVLREALDLAGPSGQDRARVLGALAQVSSGRDRRQEAHMYLREALELAFESGAHELLFQLEDLKKSIAAV